MNLTDRKQILKLTGEVGKLNGKVDQMDKNISKNFSSLEKQMIDVNNSVKANIKNHNNRINKNENNIAQIKGKTAGIAIAVSLIISIVGVIIAFFSKF